MDEIEQRLRTATDTCISSYDVWRKSQKDGDNREKLLEAVHELRKIAARLEIEIAISERDEMAAKPIPIPPHRASRRQGGNGDFADDNIGNTADNIGNREPQPQQSRGPGGGGGGSHPGLRRRSHRMGGGGGGQGGGRDGQ